MQHHHKLCSTILSVKTKRNKIQFSIKKMNNSTILLYLNSTLSLSSRFQDILYVFVLPSICMALLPLKLISITVLTVIIRDKKRKREKASQFFYLLTYETLDFIQGVIVCFTALFRCGVYCSLAYNYATKVFDLIFYIYGTAVCQQIQTFMEISFSIERIQDFKAITTSSMNRNKIKIKTKLIISLVVSLIVAVPNFLFSRTIIPVAILATDNQTLYVIATREFVQTYAWTIGLFAFDLLRGVGVLFALWITNIVLIQRFSNYVTQYHVQEFTPPNTQINAAETNMRKETVNITRLVLGINANFLFGSLPASLSPVLFQIMGSSSQIYIYFNAVAAFILIFCHFNYIFIYYKLSSSFKKTILNTLTR